MQVSRRMSIARQVEIRFADACECFARCPMIRARPRRGHDIYFVKRCWVGFASAVGAAGEIANVSQVFQPAGRLAASNSP